MVGVDIGSALIKVLRVTGSQSNPTVQGYSVLDYEGDERKLPELLQQAFSQANVSSKDEVYVGISGNGIVDERLLSNSELPKNLMDAKIISYLGKNIQKLTGYQSKDIYWDYSKSDSGIKLYFSKKKNIDDVLVIFNKANLKISGVVNKDLMINSLFRYFHNIESKKYAACFDFGFSSVKFFIIEDGVLVNQSMCDIGGGQLINDIADKYRVTHDEAKTIILEDGMGYSDYYNVILEPFYQNLVNQLQGSVRLSYQNAEISEFDEIRVMGGLVKLRGFVDYLRDNLSRSVDVLNPFESYVFKGSKVDGANLIDDSPLLINSLAVTAYRKNVYPNLFPWQSAFIKKEKDDYLRKAFMAALLGAGLSYGLYSYASDKMDQLTEDNDLLKQKIALTKEETEKFKNVQSEIEHVQANINTLQSLDSKRVVLVDALKAIVKSVPDNLYITQMVKDEKNGLIIEGKTLDATIASNFMRALKTSGWFSDVSIVSFSANKSENSGDAAAAVAKNGDGYGHFVITANFLDKKSESQVISPAGLNVISLSTPPQPSQVKDENTNLNTDSVQKPNTTNSVLNGDTHAQPK